MGADLIGFLVVGPAKLDETRRQAAAIHMRKLHTIAKRALGLRERDARTLDERD